MPNYEMKNRVTGEELVIQMPISERDSWLEQNPDWFQLLSSPGFISQKTGVLRMTPDSWKDRLKQIKDGSGKANTVKT